MFIREDVLAVLHLPPHSVEINNKLLLYQSKYGLFSFKNIYNYLSKAKWGARLRNVDWTRDVKFIHNFYYYVGNWLMIVYLQKIL